MRQKSSTDVSFSGLSLFNRQGKNSQVALQKATGKVVVHRRIRNRSMGRIELLNIEQATEKFISSEEALNDSASSTASTEGTYLYDSDEATMIDKKKDDVEAQILLKHSSNKKSYARRCVDFLQDKRVPWRRDVQIVEGLDRFLLSTPPAASEVILIAGFQPPRYLWYMLSGALCDILQISTLFVLHQFIHDGTACWGLGFLLSIPCRHTSHRYLVFGDYVGGYKKSLMRMYMGYSVIIVLSTLFNLCMSRLIEIPVSFLWIITLLWTGIANYFILKYFWSYGGNQSNISSSPSSS